MSVSGIIVFLTLGAFVFEIINLYSKKEWVKKVCEVNEKIGLIFSGPLIKQIEKHN